MWPCPAAVPGGQRAALPLPALCQPTAGVTAGVTARMGCCLGTPWHQDLALGCTGKVPVGLCCRGGAAGAVAVALVPRDGTLGDTPALSTGPSGSLPAFPGMAPGAPPLGLGCVRSEAAHSAREGTGITRGVGLFPGCWLFPLPPSLPRSPPSRARGVLASPKAPFPFQCPGELEEGHGSGPAAVATGPPAEPGPEGATGTQPWGQECSPERWDLPGSGLELFPAHSYKIFWHCRGH